MAQRPTTKARVTNGTVATPSQGEATRYATFWRPGLFADVDKIRMLRRPIVIYPTNRPNSNGWFGYFSSMT